MKELARLGHLFVCVFLYHFSAFMVVPAITDVTMAALCPGRDQCGLAIYLSGFQQAHANLSSAQDFSVLLCSRLPGNCKGKSGALFPFDLALSNSTSTRTPRKNLFVSHCSKRRALKTKQRILSQNTGRNTCYTLLFYDPLETSQGSSVPWITGLGTLMVTPLVGNLSDRYGRKALLTLPMTVAVIPLAILAYSRAETFFYIYYAVRIVAGMFCEGSMQCLPIAYVADKVGERGRASAIGVLSGVAMAGFVSGTLTSRFLSTTLTFRVSASVAVSAAVYMRVFLVESNRAASGGGPANEGNVSQAFLEAKTSAGAEAREETSVLSSSKGASMWDMIRLLRSSLTFSRAAILAFLSSLGDGGLHSSLLYYLKARFHFNKDQFADLLLIAGTAGAISQLLLMPILVPTFGEEKLLSIGLLASCTHIFLYSIAWAYWVVLSAFTVHCSHPFLSPLKIFLNCSCIVTGIFMLLFKNEVDVVYICLTLTSTICLTSSASISKYQPRFFFSVSCYHSSNMHKHHL